jgi:hypothetical protein
MCLVHLTRLAGPVSTHYHRLESWLNCSWQHLSCFSKAQRALHMNDGEWEYMQLLTLTQCCEIRCGNLTHSRISLNSAFNSSLHTTKLLKCCSSRPFSSWVMDSEWTVTRNKIGAQLLCHVSPWNPMTTVFVPPSILSLAMPPTFIFWTFVLFQVLRIEQWSMVYVFKEF